MAQNLKSSVMKCNSLSSYLLSRALGSIESKNYMAYIVFCFLTASKDPSLAFLFVTMFSKTVNVQLKQIICFSSFR